jgi:hypothetical protein
MTSSDETIQTREGEGFDAGAVGRYQREHVKDLPQGELEVEQFQQGRLTSPTCYAFGTRTRRQPGRAC